MDPIRYEDIVEHLSTPETTRRLPEQPRVLEELYEDIEPFVTPKYMPRFAVGITPIVEAIVGLPSRAQYVCLLVAIEMALECTPAACWEESDLMERLIIPWVDLFRQWVNGEISLREYVRSLNEFDFHLSHAVEAPQEYQEWQDSLSYRCQLLLRHSGLNPENMLLGPGEAIDNFLRICVADETIRPWDEQPEIEAVVHEWAARCRARLPIADWEQYEIWNPKHPELEIYGLWDLEARENAYGLPFIYATGDAENINKEAMEQAEAENPQDMEWNPPDLVISNIPLSELRDGPHESTLYGHPVVLYLWTPVGGSTRKGYVVVPGTQTEKRIRLKMISRERF